MVPECGNLLMYPCSPLGCIQSVSIPELPRLDNIPNVNYWHINITSTMSSLRTSYEVGLDFLQFLGQRISKTDINELRNIYNFEFKRFATVTQSHRFRVWLICFISFALFCLCNLVIIKYSVFCIWSFRLCMILSTWHVFFYLDAIALFFQVEFICMWLFVFRDGRQDPTFSNVINALKVFNKATTGNGKVMFRWKPKVRT